MYSNNYLNVIDQEWHRRQYSEQLGATLHRYCDDAILVLYKRVTPVLEAFVKMAEKMELTVNQEKTRITKLSDGFDFIGFNFVRRKSPRSAKSAIYICPTKQAQKAIRKKLKYVTSRSAPLKPKEFIEIIRPVLMGWVNYFSHTNASKAFGLLQHFINIRFRRYLTYRSKGRGFGWQKYPNEQLYAMGMPYIAGGWIKY